MPTDTSQAPPAPETPAKSVNGANGAAHVASPKKRTQRNGLRASSKPASVETTAPAAPLPVVAPPPVGPIEEAAEKFVSITQRFRRIQQPEWETIVATDGAYSEWEDCPSAYIYSSEANKHRVVLFLCYDLGTWAGLGETMFGVSRAAMQVRLVTGELHEMGPKEEVAVLAVNELMYPYLYMERNPDAVLQVKFAPISERVGEHGLVVMHYRCTYRRLKDVTRKEARAFLKL